MSLSTRVLDTRVSEWSRKRGPGGEIGVEVELEGTLHTGDLANRFWIVKPEGSLREGYEYVLAKPAKLSELIAVGKEFDGMMEKSRPKKTIRCSTHIHVNVNNKTIRQLYNIIGYYYLVEELLVRTQGPVRTGNLFCLRMSDAEDIGDQLVYSAEEHHITCFNQSNNKYGALNLAAPIKFGSLEFRFLLPMTSWKEIDFWVGLLHQMVNTAENLSIRDAVRFVETDSPREFLSRVFTKAHVDFILGHYGTTLAKELLLENFDAIEELSKVLTKNQFFSLPSGSWATDLNYMGVKKKPWLDATTVGNPNPAGDVIPVASLDSGEFQPMFNPIVDEMIDQDQGDEDGPGW